MAASSAACASKPIVVEICCESIDSVIAAKAGNADRVELCASLVEGGVTPSCGLMRASAAIIPTAVLVRPRAGDFVYTAAEIGVMLSDIAVAKESGAVAVVTGALLPSGHLDVATMKRLVEAAAPLEVVLHRAIDVCASPLRAVVGCRVMGIARILTSGGRRSATDAVGRLVSMRRVAECPESDLNEELRAHAAALGWRYDAGADTSTPGPDSDPLATVVIMAGGGLRHSTVRGLVDATGVSHVHGSGKPIASFMSEGEPAGSRCNCSQNCSLGSSSCT
jgi:copper homeostasis protein CutC